MSAVQSSVANDARSIFEQIRELLEATHADEFVAIEPASGRYFLGSTLSEAIGASRMAFPDRLVHAFRLGHKTAVHFGLQIR